MMSDPDDDLGATLVVLSEGGESTASREPGLEIEDGGPLIGQATTINRSIN
jgi:hypothetical protein